MAGYIGSKAVLLSTTAAVVAGDADISGDLTVDTNTLVVDAANNAVGIRTATPSAPLHVSYSNTAFLGGLRVENTATTGDNWGRIDLRSASASNDFVIAQLPDENAQINVVGNGNLILRTNNTDRMWVTSLGRVGIGTNSPAEPLEVNGGARFHGVRTRAGAAGSWGGNQFNIDWTGSPQLWIDVTNVGTITLSSDYRIKKNVQTQQAPALERVMALRPVTYELTDYGSLFEADNVQREGFIAHEVQEVIPSGADGEKDEPNRVQNLRVDAILSVVVKAMQEQQAIIDALEARIVTLEGGAA